MFLKEKGIGKNIDVVPDVFFPCSDRYIAKNSQHQRVTIRKIFGLILAWVAISDPISLQPHTELIQVIQLNI